MVEEENRRRFAMDDLFLKLTLIPVAGYFMTRIVVALLQAFGWHPEKQFEKYARQLVRSARTRYLRFRRRKTIAIQDRDRPIVENAPGLVWKRRAHGWDARWNARTDIKTFEPRTVRLWSGIEPSAVEADYIADTCRRLQDAMLDHCRKQRREEPSMEEILASIRKIIADDGPTSKVPT
jgi:hypothetical protein